MISYNKSIIFDFNYYQNILLLIYNLFYQNTNHQQEHYKFFLNLKI